MYLKISTMKIGAESSPVYIKRDNELDGVQPEVMTEALSLPVKQGFARTAIIAPSKLQIDTNYLCAMTSINAKGELETLLTFSDGASHYYADGAQQLSQEELNKLFVDYAGGKTYLPSSFSWIIVEEEPKQDLVQQNKATAINASSPIEIVEPFWRKRAFLVFIFVVLPLIAFIALGFYGVESENNRSDKAKSNVPVSQEEESNKAREEIAVSTHRSLVESFEDSSWKLRYAKNKTDFNTFSASWDVPEIQDPKLQLENAWIRAQKSAQDFTPGEANGCAPAKTTRSSATERCEYEATFMQDGKTFYIKAYMTLFEDSLDFQSLTLYISEE